MLTLILKIDGRDIANPSLWPDGWEESKTITYGFGYQDGYGDWVREPRALPMCVLESDPLWTDKPGSDNYVAAAKFRGISGLN